MKQNTVKAGLPLLRRVRLQPRLLVSYLFLSLVPVLVVGAFAYNVYTRSIERNLAQSAEQAVKMLNATVVSELEKYASYINSISVSETVQTVLQRPESARVPLEGSVALAIKQRVQELPVQSVYLKNIRIVDSSGKVIYDQRYNDIPDMDFPSILETLDAASPQDSLQFVKTYRGVNNLVLGRKIYAFARPSVHIGYILIYIDETLLSGTIFPDIRFGESNILLMNGSGIVLSSQNKELLGANLLEGDGFYGLLQAAAKRGESNFSTEIGGAPHLVIFDYSPAIDTYFIATIPDEFITGETGSITQRLIFVAALMILISFGIAMLIYRSITLPIRRIVRFCSEATEDKITRHIDDQSPDELGFLTLTVDRFVHQIQGLLHKSKLDGRRKRELELEMLQYQINPHFLFNTLNTLRWVAVLNEVPVLSEGISSLAQLLQSTLLEKDEMIPLSEELENVKHYVSIQRIRYGDSFQFDCRVEDALESVLVPRFILQPLVENAILHGAWGNGRSIRITVSAESFNDSDMLLAVVDDGQGFDPQDMTRPIKERFSGIGLPNVHERLTLTFGAPYGLTVESTPGEGTVCRILLPK